MLTLDSTLQKIREGGYKMVLLSYYPTRTQCFRANKFTAAEDEDVEDMLEKIAREVLRYPADTKFLIEARETAKTQEAAGHRWEFSQDGADRFTKTITTAAVQTQPSFSGFGNVDPSSNPLWLKIEDRRAEMDRERRELDREHTDFKIEKARFEDKKKDFEDKIAQTRLELASLEHQYTSNAAAARKGFESLLRELVVEFGKSGNLGGFAGRLMGLGDASEEPASDTPAVLTEEDRVIETIAVMIQGEKLTLDELNRLGATIQKYIRKTFKKPDDGISQ